MPQLAIIADDLTGAADTSACFATAGYATVIPLSGAPPPVADVLALSTESRDMDAAEAAEAVIAAVKKLAEGPERPRWLYKKIDSALRGHPREELFAAMAAAGATATIVAPALPAEGRTTVRGHQHIDGVPLEFSSLGHPAAISDLGQIFANDRGWPPRAISLQTIRHDPAAIQQRLAADRPGIVVADAELDADLAVLARAAAASQIRLFCGAAGFARQLAPLLPLTPAVPIPVTPRQGKRPILVVAGSRHGATTRQIAALGRTETPVVQLAQAHIDDLACSVGASIAEVAGHLRAGRTTVVTTTGLAPSSSGERAVASRLAEIAAAPQVQRTLGGLVLTGGDVAMAVCQALGATALWLGGEIYAGQPWGLLGGGVLPGLSVATKAGSFGGEDALLRCVEHLRKLDAMADHPVVQLRARRQRSNSRLPEAR